MSSTKLATKGQIALPKFIRAHLKRHIGDTVEFIIDWAGNVIGSVKTQPLTAI